ncbi:MAG: thiol protease/hemagglutinin PrtT [Paludibacteraceae bacterium]
MHTDVEYNAIPIRIRNTNRLQRITLTIIASLASLVLSFAQITESEIKQRAEMLFNTFTADARTYNTSPMRKVQSIKAIKRKERPYLYVANMQDGGWAILSNEPKYTPIVGYGDTGEFLLDTTSMPPALCLLLEHHMNNIDSLRASANYEAMPANEAMPNNIVVCAPLLSNNQWKQSGNNGYDFSCDHAYNKQCPTFYDVSCGKPYAGCSAVAMAQIMRYWQWPDYAQIRAHISMAGVTHGDLITRYYDWDNMPLSMNNNTPLYQVDAITWLLVNCGYAANMVYSGDIGSAAGIDKINSAMQTEFNYHTKRIHEYAGTDMVPILKQELDNKRPILCQAWSSLTSAHSFVIDGYTSTGKFFINWGWGLSNNGYYDMGFNGYDANRTYLTEIYPNCPSRNANINGITETQIAANDKRTYYSTQWVSLCSNGKNLTIQPNGHLIVEAGNQIVLSAGFHAAAGSQARFSIRNFCNSITPQNMKVPQHQQEETFDDNITASAIRISPNPTTGLLNIESDKAIQSVAVYQLDGQKITEQTGNTVELYAASAGIYIVHIYFTDGSVYTDKVIKTN